MDHQKKKSSLALIIQNLPDPETGRKNYSCYTEIALSSTYVGHIEAFYWKTSSNSSMKCVQSATEDILHVTVFKCCDVLV